MWGVAVSPESTEMLEPVEGSGISCQDFKAWLKSKCETQNGLRLG